MEKRNKSNEHTMSCNCHDFKLKIVFESIIVGMLTGVIISFLRFLVNKSGHLLVDIYKIIELKHQLIPIWIVFVIIIGYIIGLIIKKNAVIRGSGIPQVEGVLLGKIGMTWWKVILGKFVGSFLAIGSGLSLGIEGPSVQLGAAVGQGFSKILKKVKKEEKYLIISGTSAGIAAAFNAPLAGTMFALEEIHKKLSPSILILAFSAAAASNFVSCQFFGFKPVFDFRDVPMIPLNYYLLVIVLGIIIGVLGGIFNKVLLKVQNIFFTQKWIPIEFRPMFCIAISIFIGFFLPQVLGEGDILIMSLGKGNIAIKLLVILLVCKFIFSMICCGSGTPGGIFLPLFTIGALIGGIYGSIFRCLFNMNSIYIGSFIVIAMAGYFSSVIRAPMSGSILVIEMTGSFSNILPIIVISIVSYVTAYVLKSKPIYESLLEKL